MPRRPSSDAVTAPPELASGQAPGSAVTRERIGLHNCPVVEVTGDGRACGRCWFYLPGPEHKTCPRHGDVSLEVEVYIREGKTTREDRRPTAPSATPTAS